jgi:antitoxin (DNA-binding transcriptional repressor) of toxin-antitoxin stability system
MTTAGVRELKNHLSQYLRRLKPGKAVAITDRGRVVAELRRPAVASASSALAGGYARLLDEGVIQPARETGDPLSGLGTERRIAAPPGTVAALIREDRGD